jgi:eukaryotic-like serine/threonine-protein kinase
MDRPSPIVSSKPLNTGTVRFGTFSVDLNAGELRKGATKIKLYGQPFSVLATLLGRPGQVVTREELQQKLWASDTFVDFEHGLNKAINKLREALGDDADNPRFVETLPRRGYRFIAPVEAVPVKEMQPAPAPPELVRKETHRLDSWRLRLVVAGAAIAGLAVAVGGYLYLHRTPKLTEKDSIIIADFTNMTGDPVFDGTLRQGLSVQLEQSPFFNILSGDKIAEQLRLMEKPPDTRLAADVAREVCERLNAKAAIEGSIAALDSQYVIGLNAVNCHTGETLAEEQATADGKTKVLATIGNAASNLRSKLGESRASLKAYDVPLVQSTTSSLNALQAFARCEEGFFRSNYLVAVSLCQQAISIDPKFANAYGLLGILYDNLQQKDLEAEAVKKAYDLRDRTSEREKLLILWVYYFYSAGDLERTLEVSRQDVQTYPRDPRAFIGLGTIYRVLGRYDEALAAHEEVLRLDPTVTIAYRLLAMSYIAQNRPDEARSILERARARGLDPPNFSFELYDIALLQKDAAGMAEQASRLGRLDPGTRSYLEASAAGNAGQLSRSRSVIRSAIAAATKANVKWAAAGLAANSSVQEALFGNVAEARSAASEALKLKKESTDWDTEGTAAFSLALAGDTARAERLAADLNRRLPEGTFVQFVYLPAIQAAVALDEGRPQEAIEILRVASPYELTPDGIFSAYLRGEAYLSGHQGAEAAAEFQKIIDHPGLVVSQPIGPLAHLGLARAYALEGDTAKAGAAYKDFLTLWKDADAHVPIFKQAKAEYAKLK